MLDGGLGRGRRFLPRTGEVEKVDGEGSEWVLSRGLAAARRKGRRGKEKGEANRGKGLTTRLWVWSGGDLGGYTLVAMWTVDRIIIIDIGPAY